MAGSKLREATSHPGAMTELEVTRDCEFLLPNTSLVWNRSHYLSSGLVLPLALIGYLPQ